MIRNPRLLLYLALVLAVLNLISASEPRSTIPLIHADYQRCMTVQNAPLDKGHGIPLRGERPPSGLA